MSRLRVIGKRKWLIGIVVCFVFSLLCLFFYTVEQPIYSATTSLIINNQGKTSLSNGSFSFSYTPPQLLTEIVKTTDFIQQMNNRLNRTGNNVNTEKLGLSVTATLSDSLLYVRAITNSKEESINYSITAAEILKERTSIKFVLGEYIKERCNKIETYKKSLQSLRHELSSTMGIFPDSSKKELEFEIDDLIRQKTLINNELRLAIDNLNTSQNKDENILLASCHHFLSKISKITKKLETLYTKKEKHKTISSSIAETENSLKSLKNSLDEIETISILPNYLILLEKASVSNCIELRADLGLIILVSIALGMTVGLVTQVLDNKIHDIQDISDYSSFKVIGIIPRINSPILIKMP